MLNKIKKLSFSPFKKVSLTFKITLWYTTFIVLLIGSLIIGTFFVSDGVVESGAKKRLVEEVTEISSGSDKFTPYEDGVTLSVYDKDGNLVAGSVPRNFKVNNFSLGAISEYKDINHNKYLYYDSETSSARLGNGKYVRGIVQVTNNINGWLLPIIISIGSPFVIIVLREYLPKRLREFGRGKFNNLIGSYSMLVKRILSNDVQYFFLTASLTQNYPTLARHLCS